MEGFNSKKTLLEASGYHIPPYRLARMSDLSNKIVKMIMTDGVVAFTADEAKLILHLAGEVVRAGSEKWE